MEFRKRKDDGRVFPVDNSSGLKKSQVDDSEKTPVDKVPKNPFSEQLGKEFLKFIKNNDEITEPTVVRVIDGDHMGTGLGKTVELMDDTEWVVYDSYNDAKSALEISIRNNLKDEEPDKFAGFHRDFIMFFMDMSDLDKRLFAGELADSAMEGISDDDLKDMADNYDVPYSDNDDFEEGGKIWEKVRDAVDDSIEDELKKDAKDYLSREFGDEEVDRLVENGTLRVWDEDIQYLVRDAIASDGLGHFISPYDGNYHGLPDGKIVARIN